MTCHMTLFPLFGSASARNQRLLKSHKTETEVENSGRAASEIEAEKDSELFS